MWSIPFLFIIFQVGGGLREDSIPMKRTSSINLIGYLPFAPKFWIKILSCIGHITAGELRIE